MLYRPYIHGLYAAIHLPIHRYVYQRPPQNTDVTDASGGDIDNSGSGDSSFNPYEAKLVISESYEPRGLSPTYRLQATNFAQKLHLNLGDKIYMRSVQDLAAVLLPDNSLVVIGTLPPTPLLPLLQQLTPLLTLPIAVIVPRPPQPILLLPL